MENPKQPTKHHRRPRSIGGTSSSKNISIVPDNKHRAWHLLFGNMEPVEIVREINKFWIDYRFRLKAEKFQ